jgi:ABC-type phosphate transport system auxiliary subunit
MLQPINIELYQFLEERLGKEEARKVAEVIERSFEAIEKKAEEVALQKKLEIKDELTKELATKADIARLEGKVKADIARLEGEIQTFKADFEGKISSLKADLEGKISVLRMEFRVYFVILIAVIILSSPRAVDLIGKILGVVK